MPYISIKTIEQGNESFKLQFYGIVQTRQTLAILLPCGQTGGTSPICISFRGSGTIEDITSHKADVSENSVNITGNDNATVSIPLGIRDNWGKFTLILLNKNLSVSIN